MIRIAVRVRRDHAELVLAELLELAPGGVEESATSSDVVEYAIYGAPGELPELPDLRAAAGKSFVEISTSEVADDWDERWRRFHRPILLQAPAVASGSSRRALTLQVAPPWEASPDAGGERSAERIVIDPGRAFGTGAHATTRMCLELLLELVAARVAAGADRSLGAALDVGTGSGVLAIAAARLGFTPVLALDNDRASVDAARANAAVNDTSIDVRRLDLRNEGIPWLGGGGAASRSHDSSATPTVVLANLLAPLLLDVARAMTAPPAHLLASGLLVEQVDEIVAAFRARHEMHEHRRARSGEWAAVWLRARKS